MDREFYRNQLINQNNDLYAHIDKIENLSIRLCVTQITASITRLCSLNEPDKIYLYLESISTMFYIFECMLKEMGIHEEGANAHWKYEYRHLQYCIEYFEKYYL